MAISLRVAAALVIAGGWFLALAGLGGGAQFRTDRRLTGIVAGAAAAVVLSAVLSPVRWDSLLWGFAEGTSAAYWLACLVIFVGAASVRVGTDTRRALGVGVALLLIYAVVAIGQRLGGADTARLVLGGSNYIGPLAAMAAPVALGLARTTARRTEQAAWLISAIVLAAAVVITGSAAAAGGLLAVSLGVVFFRPQLLGVSGRHARILRIGAVVVAAALVFAVAVAIWSSGVLPAGLDARIEYELLGSSTADRVELWRAAVGMFAERPLAGWGPDGFAFGVQGHASRDLMQAIYHQEGLLFDPRLTFPQDPHSLPLSVLAEFGMLGIVAFGALGVLWVRRAVSVPEGPERAQDLRVSCALGVLAVVVAGLALPLSSTSGLFVVVLAGFAITEPGGARSERKSRSGIVAATIYGVFAVSVAVALIGAGALGASAANAPNPAARARTAAKAASMAPGSTLRAYQMLWASVGRVGAGLDADEFIRIYESAPENVQLFAPYATDLTRRLSRAETTPDVLQWADEQLAVATEMAPAYPESFMERAWVAYSLGRQEEGAKYWEQASWASGSAIYQTYEPEIARLSK